MSKAASNLDSNDKIPFWRQIRWSLIFSSIILAVLPVALVVAVTVPRTTTQARTQVINQLSSIAELKTAQINTWLENSEATLHIALAGPDAEDRIVGFVASSLAAGPQYEQEQRDLNLLLRETVDAQDTFEEIFIYDASGRIVLASDEAQIGKVVTSQPYYQPSQQAKDHIQPPFYAVGSSDLVMFVTHSVLHAAEEPAATLAGRLNLGILGQIMTERTGLGNSGETYLVSRESNYFVTPSRYESEGYVRTRAYHSLGIDRALAGADGASTYDNYLDPPESVIGVYRWLPELQVAMLAEVSETQVLAANREARNFSFLLALIAAVTAALIGLVIATRISSPIVTLTGAATRIAAGQLDQEVEVSTRNEVGLLATTFNNMTTRLRGMIHGEQQQRQYLQSMIDQYAGFMADVGRGNLALRLELDRHRLEAGDPLQLLGQQLNDTIASLQAMILQIRNAATDLNEAAAEIMAATTQQVSGAAEQSAAISQTTTTVDEVKVIADQSVARAQEVADSAQRTVHTSRDGHQAVQATIDSMARIKDQVEAIAANILTLSGHTQQIGTIIATVNDIAAQSNMLALNAAV
ncbi:MAG: cache domain-containing protein, partial [Anaerolineae bacterium]